MATRRKFIQQSSTLVLGSLLIPQLGKSGLFSKRKVFPPPHPFEDGTFSCNYLKKMLK